MLVGQKIHRQKHHQGFNGAMIPNTSEHAVTAAPGELQVQDNDVGTTVFQDGKTVNSARGLFDGIAEFLEVRPTGLAKARISHCDQKSRFHGFSLRTH